MRRYLVIGIAVAAGILIGLGLRFFTSRPRPEAIRPPPARQLRFPLPKFRPAARARVAIVIDDWGYNRKNLPLLTEIRRPLTLAVLPRLPFSTEVAGEGRRLGEEIILHLPLAAVSRSVKPESVTIAPGMSAEEIRRIVEEAEMSVPGIDGVSNHMGSAATADRELMRLVLGEIKKRRLFFLDSATTANSVAGEVCRDEGVPWIRRDVFLDVTAGKDEEETRRLIGERLHRLAEVARERGRAVGIGHDRALTLEVLRDTMPELEKEGIRFVRLSELLK